jgi:2-polyprenyl-6-methoxyphenol hydroxylase-like FAD-dependent oxidoreductase
VVIVGGSYAGMGLALSLQDHFNVTVVDKNAEIIV